MSTATLPLGRTTDRTGSRTNPLAAFLRTPKGSLTLLFVPFLALAVLATGWDAALPHVLVAVAGASLVDLLVARLAYGAWRWPSGAFLSGAIVALVLDPLQPHVVTFAVAVLASASKHVFRTRRGHVFNPAGFALLVSAPLFATAQSWWGAFADMPWPFLLLLIAGGFWIAGRVNKLPLVLSFTGAYFALFTFGALRSPARVAEMFRAPFLNAALFMAFFMLTDPPTSPGRYTDQVAIGALVAAVACAAQLAGVGQSYLLVGLVVGNLALAWRRSLGNPRREV